MYEYIVHSLETKERNGSTKEFYFSNRGGLRSVMVFHPWRVGSRDTRGSINTSLLASAEETYLEIDTDYWTLSPSLFLSLGGGDIVITKPLHARQVSRTCHKPPRRIIFSTYHPLSDFPSLFLDYPNRVYQKTSLKYSPRKDSTCSMILPSLI